MTVAQFPKEIDLKLNTSFTVARPGDTLVIAVDKKLDMQEAEDMKMRLQELLPGIMIFVVEANQLLVYRPDTAPYSEQRIREIAIQRLREHPEP
jgi:hypothetical protein